MVNEITVGFVGPMASEYRDDGIPFLRSQNVLPHRLDLQDVKFIGPDFHRRIVKSTLRPGDVVTVRTGKPGTTAVIPPGSVEMNCADLVVTRPGRRVDSRWLSYYLNSVATASIAANLVGAVQQHFNVGAAKALELLLPSIAEQQAIADLLGALDDKIASNRRAAVVADALVRALFASYGCGAPDVIRLDSLVASPRNNVEPGAVPADTTYVGLEHLPRHRMWLDDWADAESVSSSKLAFERGDVLFGKLRPYFHKVCSAPTEGLCSTDIIVCRVMNTGLRGFVLAALASDAVVERCSAASAGTRMPRTNWRELGAIEIPWLGECDSVEMGIHVEAIRDAAEAGLAENRTLSTLRDVLISDLLSGRLRMKDAEKQVEDVL